MSGRVIVDAEPVYVIGNGEIGTHLDLGVYTSTLIRLAQLDFDLAKEWGGILCLLEGLTRDVERHEDVAASTLLLEACRQLDRVRLLLETAEKVVQLNRID